MGNHLSSWQNPEARDYASFLQKVLGYPSYGNPRAGGVIVWNADALAKRKLFGQPVCFDRVMVLDERVPQSIPRPAGAFLHVAVLVPASDPVHNNAGRLLQISQGLVYDYQRGCLRVRADCLENAILLLRVATDTLLGRAIVRPTGVNSYTAKTMAGHYTALVSNLAALAKLPSAASPSSMPAQNPTYMTDFTSTERFDNPYVGYSSNDPYFLAAEQDRDDLFYSTPRPFLGGANHEPNVAYASNQPNYDSIEHLAIHPKCQGECAKRVAQQFAKDNRKARESMERGRLAQGAKRRGERREHLTQPDGSYAGRPTYSILSVPAASTPAPIERYMPQPVMNYGGRPAYNIMSVPAASYVPSSTRSSVAAIERLTSEPDPRFLVGSGDLYYNVGSDINDITRVYGTVEQNRVFPKYTDAVAYGITGIPKVPTSAVERRKLVKPKVSSNFKPVSQKRESFVSTGSAHVQQVLAEEGAGNDPFLYWTEGK